MKTGLLTSLLFLMLGLKGLMAQTLPFTVFTTDKNLSFQKVITTHDGKMLVIFGREKWMELCDYLWIGVHDKADSRSREIKLIPDKSRASLYFKDAITTSDELWFVYYNYIKTKHTIEVVLIPFDVTTGKLNTTQEIRLPQVDANAVLNGSFYVFQSPDKNHLGILNVSGLLDDYKKKFFMCSVNLQTKKINFTLQDFLPADAHIYQLLKPMIDNAGRYYVLSKRYREPGSELVSNKSNYFYLIEHFENNITRRSTGIYTDENSIVRYPDALIHNNETMRVCMMITDTSLIHPEKIVFRHYDLHTHEMYNDTIIKLQNPEPRINSSFVSELFDNNQQVLYTASGQYLEDVVGARLSHAYDVIKTYSVIAGSTSNETKTIIVKTPARLRESQDFLFPLNQELHYISYAPGSSENLLWSCLNLKTWEISKTYNISNQVWRKNLPYYFASCMNKPLVLQSMNTRYQIIYLP